jgi:hypothetical protein
MTNKTELERRYEAYLRELDRKEAKQPGKRPLSTLQRRLLLQIGNRLTRAGQELKMNVQNNP